MRIKSFGSQADGELPRPVEEPPELDPVFCSCCCCAAYKVDWFRMSEMCEMSITCASATILDEEKLDVLLLVSPGRVCVVGADEELLPAGRIKLEALTTEPAAAPGAGSGAIVPPVTPPTPGDVVVANELADVNGE